MTLKPETAEQLRSSLLRFRDADARLAQFGPPLTPEAVEVTTQQAAEEYIAARREHQASIEAAESEVDAEQG